MGKEQILRSGQIHTEPFILKMSVRDYECDIQSIVNHAVYFNYLEHTRHEFLKSKGTSFLEWHQKGKNLVVVKLDASFKQSLKSGDTFYSYLTIFKYKKASLTFLQRLCLADNTTLFEAYVSCACVYKQKAIAINELVDLLL